MKFAVELTKVISFQMAFVCWSCEESFKSRDELRNHFMRRPHRFLEVVCPWCTTKEMFRRPVDLRLHITEKHRSIRRQQGKDFPTDQEAFFVATRPRAYLNSIKGEPTDGPRTSMLKEAVLNSQCLGSAEMWQRGWDRHGPLCGQPPYSPSKPQLWTVESLSLDHEGGKVIVTGGVGETIRFTIPCEDRKHQERLLRMMATVKPGMEVPDSWTTCDDVDAAKILTSVGLGRMSASRVERNNWTTDQPPCKKARKDGPPSPFTPLATPQHEPQLEVPPVSPARPIDADCPSPSMSTNIEATDNAATTQHADQVEDALPPSAPPCEVTDEATIPQSTADLLPARDTTSSDSHEDQQQAQPVSVHPSPDAGLTDSSRRAYNLLMLGGMPLFPPARRNWNDATTLQLPLEGSFQTWPPAGWPQMYPDGRLLLWEMVSTNLAMKWSLPLDRSFILDSFQFLALPGSKDANNTSPECRMRHSNFTILRKIATGQSVVGSEALLSMFGQALLSSVTSIPGEYRDLVVAASNLPLRI